MIFPTAGPLLVFTLMVVLGVLMTFLHYKLLQNYVHSEDEHLRVSLNCCLDFRNLISYLVYI